MRMAWLNIVMWDVENNVFCRMLKVVERSLLLSV